VRRPRLRAAGSRLLRRLRSDSDAILSGIFGVARRDGGPLEDSSLERLRDVLPPWGPDGFGLWRDGSAGLGQARARSTPEAGTEQFPLDDSRAGFAFTAAARLDNRDELLREHSLPGAASDEELVLACYRRWADRAPERLLGDWSFAAWHPSERRLFLARDHFGTGAIYYRAERDLLAFAPSQRALLAFAPAKAELDELYLAQYLISWTAYYGERTTHPAILRLPPAHTLTLTPERLSVRCYWRMEEVTPLRLRRRADYVGAFREHFDQAVRTRLRSPQPAAITLSGGLDSGAVAVTAASQLSAGGARLAAFTSVPVADPAPYLGSTIGDELPLARATADAASNIDLQPLACAGASPIAAIRRALDVYDQPIHAAANAYWLLAVADAARAAGCGVLLSGGLGNAGISWTGDPLSQRLGYQLRNLGVGGALRSQLRRAAPRRLRAARAQRLAIPFVSRSAIHPELARRVDLETRLREDLTRFHRSPLERRFAILMPGRGHAGALSAARGAAHRLDPRDPTTDTRLLRFVLSVPDWVYIDPRTGLNRWLLREAMRDRLPDQVRLNRRHGLQAADLVPRLRAAGADVERALDELAAGPGGDYVDVGRLREAWRSIQVQDTPAAWTQAVLVLTRGIMAGLHANAVLAPDGQPVADR
jgi:asparagine synthase (glutamine-hydrolysing)